GDFVAVEALEGGTLAERVSAAGRLPLDRATQFAAQIAQALAAAHQQGVVHGRLGPSSVLLADDDTVKVDDFGWAGAPRAVDSAAAAGDEAARADEDAMPPEAVLGAGAPRPEWDQFGLGATFFYMLTGKAPRIDKAPRSSGQVPLLLDHVEV